MHSSMYYIGKITVTFKLGMQVTPHCNDYLKKKMNELLILKMQNPKEEKSFHFLRLLIHLSIISLTSTEIKQPIQH